MKKTIYELLVNILVFIFIVGMFSSVQLPKEITYILVVFLAAGLASLLYRPVLKFLTVKINFWTKTLVITILLAVLMYILTTFLPGFYVVDTVISRIALGSLTINTITIPQIGTMLIVSFLTGIIISFLELLKSE